MQLYATALETICTNKCNYMQQQMYKIIFFENKIIFHVITQKIDLIFTKYDLMHLLLHLVAHVPANLYAYIFMYAHIYLHMCTPIFTYVYTYTYICTHIYLHMSAHLFTYIFTVAHRFFYIFFYSCICVARYEINRQTYINTCIHVPAQLLHMP